MKIYYNMLVMLDNKEVILDGPIPLTPEEKDLLGVDIEELKSSIVMLRGAIKDAYGVETFSDVATEILKYIEGDPYHRLAIAVYGPQGDLSAKAICGSGLFGVKIGNEIN